MPQDLFYPKLGLGHERGTLAGRPVHHLGANTASGFVCGRTGSPAVDGYNTVALRVEGDVGANGLRFARRASFRFERKRGGEGRERAVSGGIVAGS